MAIDHLDDVVEFGLVSRGEVWSLGQEATHQVIGILIAAALVDGLLTRSSFPVFRNKFWNTELYIRLFAGRLRSRTGIFMRKLLQ